MTGRGILSFLFHGTNRGIKFGGVDECVIGVVDTVVSDATPEVAVTVNDALSGTADDDLSRDLDGDKFGGVVEDAFGGVVEDPYGGVDKDAAEHSACTLTDQRSRIRGRITAWARGLAAQNTETNVRTTGSDMAFNAAGSEANVACRMTHARRATASDGAGGLTVGDGTADTCHGSVLDGPAERWGLVRKARKSVPCDPYDRRWLVSVSAQFTVCKKLMTSGKHFSITYTRTDVDLRLLSADYKWLMLYEYERPFVTFIANVE